MRRLKKDMVAEVVRGCGRHSRGVIGYYSVFPDTASALQHPDWRLQAESKTGAGYGNANFHALCVDSPYLEELMIPQCVEVATR